MAYANWILRSDNSWSSLIKVSNVCHSTKNFMKKHIKTEI